MAFGIFKSQEKSGPSQYKPLTKVYSCAFCGRLYNYSTFPCPNCGGVPKSLRQMARTISLSNDHFKIFSLLLLAREVGGGRSPEEVIPNLEEIISGYMEDHKKLEAVTQLFDLLKIGTAEDRGLIGNRRLCKSCHERVFFSNSDECGSCDESLDWDTLTRLLVCADNLLWLFERRSESSTNENFSKFIESLVLVVEGLMRRKGSIVKSDVEELVGYMIAASPLCDKNLGGVIEISKDEELKIYIVQDKMDENTDGYTKFLYSEVQNLIDIKNSL